MYGINHQQVEWTEEKITLLKTMWAAGASHSEISARIPGSSRSAIAGKIMRLKLSRAATGPRPQRPRRVTPRPQLAKPPADPGLEVKLQAFLNRKDRLLKPEVIEPRSDTNVKLLGLTNNTCRWPIGHPCDENFIYCGEPTANLEERRPYCPFHTLKATDRTGMRRSSAHAQPERQPA